MSYTQIARAILIALLLGFVLIAGAFVAQPDCNAETCLSPFVKRLNRPEKLLYVWCVDADGKDNDFMIVVDVHIESKSYGQIVYQLDLGSAGNETHHFGFTDDRTHLWGCSLFSNRVFLIDVATDPAKPKLVKTLDNVAAQSGFTGPHSPYALPGRMLISFLGGSGGGLPAGLAEFTNDGQFIRRIEQPQAAPYGYDVAIQPGRNRMITSSFTPPANYRKPLAQMDLKNFGSELLVWDFRERKVIQTLKAGLAPLECRWSLKEANDHGFTNCLLENSIWVWEGDGKGGYSTRKLCETGQFPADLRQSPDDRFLYVSCFGSNDIQQWDVSDLKQPRLVSSVVPGVHPNMMHVSGDGRRMYISNSLLSTADRSENFWVRLAHIGPDGLKMDPFFHIDLTKFKTGPARGHDMLFN